MYVTVYIYLFSRAYPNMFINLSLLVHTYVCMKSSHMHHPYTNNVCRHKHVTHKLMRNIWRWLSSPTYHTLLIFTRL